MDIEIIKELKTLSERINDISQRISNQNDDRHKETSSNIEDMILEQADMLIEISMMELGIEE